MIEKIKEHMKSFPKAPMYGGYPDDRAHLFTLSKKWFDELEAIIVVCKQ